MIVVRQWMTNSRIKSAVVFSSLLFSFSSMLVSCNPTEIASSGQRAAISYSDPALANKAYVYQESPAILAGSNYGPHVDIKKMIAREPVFITSKNQLKGDCTLSLFTGSSTITDCLHGYGEKSPSQVVLPRRTEGNWAFLPGTSEFYQVNGFYHVQKGINKFFEKLKFSYDTLHGDPTISWKTKQIPGYLNQTGLHWFQPMTTNDTYFNNSFLSVYSLCDLELNALFSPVGPELCFGKWSSHSTFLFVQDPSVIYHELGHALIAVMMNMRNGIPGFPTPTYHALRSNLGGNGYNEAGNLGEGIADYYSYVMNGRTHMGEWALGKSMDASRPMSEDDAIHISGIDTTSEGRLSYPQFLHYDPNQPNIPFQDIHYAGQIVSHYLVALTKTLQNECSLSSGEGHDKSTSFVMLLIAETLSELGDLRAVGLDTSGGGVLSTAYRFNNLDETSSYMWAHVVNPPTYRRFFQVFSKNILKFITGGLCTGFSQAESEKLLDDYGLLLFKNYNDNGKSTKSASVKYSSTGVISTTSTATSTKVQEGNRRKSVLVSKDLLVWATPDTDKDVVKYYVIDDQTMMADYVADLLFKGYPMNPSVGVASIEYNNGNAKISPGEIVAIIPNLHNESNSTIAGVHLLATDWDHVHITDTTGNNGNFKPCVFDGDTETTAAQGGETGGTCTTTMSTYKRHVKNSLGKFSTTEAAAPVCLVQLEDGEVATWVSQNEFRKKQGLSLLDKDCLGYGGAEQTEDLTFNPHECLVRTVPGAQQAFYSKIDPQMSFAETIRTGNPDYKFDRGNSILFEVSKWVPPGTKFRCRLRARFSNCSNCFQDSTTEDYIDAELNGAKPYKIINFDFEVND